MEQTFNNPMYDTHDYRDPSNGQASNDYRDPSNGQAFNEFDIAYATTPLLSFPFLSFLFLSFPFPFWSFPFPFLCFLLFSVAHIQAPSTFPVLSIALIQALFPTFWCIAPTLVLVSHFLLYNPTPLVSVPSCGPSSNNNVTMSRVCKN